MEPRTLLALARMDAGLTQRELAVEAGVSQSTVARIERGAIDPRASTLDRLLRVCGREVSMQRAQVDRNGIDRSLIRSALELEPSERIEGIVAVTRFVAQARPAAEVVG